MADMPIDIADPRTFPASADPGRAALIELAEAALAATTPIRADEIDRALIGKLIDELQSGRGTLLADAIANAPSPGCARALWRALIAAWTTSGAPEGSGVAVTLFALPVVIIAGRDAPAAATETELAGVLADTERLASLLREHRALAGNQTFALAPSLVASDAIDVPRLGELLIGLRRANTQGVAVDFAPVPIAVQPGQQGVHLRFLIGTALAAPGIDLLADSHIAKWGMAFALEMARQLSIPGVSVLALPRPPQSPPAALLHGRAAQREVGAQLFASNAIRRLRASVGEPSAAISAHRSPASPGGGELRVSLSSAFDPRQAEGFRCPLFPTDRAGDVAQMLFELLRDCRVADVRVIPGVHPDRDPQTGMLLLFKAEAVARAEPTLH